MPWPGAIAQQSLRSTRIALQAREKRWRTMLPPDVPWLFCTA
jgi:hypothetical protein